MLAVAGTVYALLTGIAARRMMQPAAVGRHRELPSVDVLKPLRGTEPELFANLASFAAQDYPGTVRLVFGVADAIDPAVACVAELRRACPSHDIALVIDATSHGENGKVSNLVNMDRRCRNEIVVLADSDIRVDSDYLRRIIEALLAPGVGAVSCLYRGYATHGIWSRLSALGIDAHFLPNAALGIAFGLARPCFGSTIALRRLVLERVGGFGTLQDQLADDYALGEAVRALGLAVHFPPVIVDHLCSESSLAELWSHDLRWARTIRAVNPAGYAGSMVTHPVAFAVLAALASGGAVWSLAFVAAITSIRLVSFRYLERVFALQRGRLHLLPLRDLLSFAVFAWSFAGRSVAWRGTRLDVAAGGVLVSAHGPVSDPNKPQ